MRSRDGEAARLVGHFWRRRIVIGGLPHKVVLSVLVFHGDFQRALVDEDVEWLFGDFFDGILDGLSVDRKADVGISLYQVQPRDNGRLVVGSRDGESVVLDVKKEAVENRKRVLCNNNATNGLETRGERRAGDDEFHVAVSVYAVFLMFVLRAGQRYELFCDSGICRPKNKFAAPRKGTFRGA